MLATICNNIFKFL